MWRCKFCGEFAFALTTMMECADCQKFRHARPRMLAELEFLEYRERLRVRYGT